MITSFFCYNSKNLSLVISNKAIPLKELFLLQLQLPNHINHFLKLHYLLFDLQMFQICNLYTKLISYLVSKNRLKESWESMLFFQRLIDFEKDNEAVFLFLQVPFIF